MNRKDIWFVRGNEYKIYNQKKDEYKSKEIIQVSHYNPITKELKHNKPVKTSIWNLVNTDWTCPVCDNNSRKRVFKKLESLLKELSKKYDFTYDNDYTRIGFDRSFDYVIFTSSGRKIYINYFIGKYFRGEKEIDDTLKDIREGCSKRNMKYVEMTYFNYSKKFSYIEKLIKKYS